MVTRYVCQVQIELILRYFCREFVLALPHRTYNRYANSIVLWIFFRNDSIKRFQILYSMCTGAGFVACWPEIVLCLIHTTNNEGFNHKLGNLHNISGTWLTFYVCVSVFLDSFTKIWAAFFLALIIILYKIHMSIKVEKVSNKARILIKLCIATRTPNNCCKT